MVYLLAFLMLVGHWVLCLFVINRAHATSLPYWLIKVIDGLWYLSVFGVPLMVMAYLANGRPDWLASFVALEYLIDGYVGVCWFAAAALFPMWLRYYTDSGTTDRLLSSTSCEIDLIQRIGHRPVGSFFTNMLSRIPTNQVFDLAITEKTFRLPRLNRGLDGLTITHLSDLHFTGRVTREFYEVVVDEANQLDADIVAITGDIIDKRVCSPWLDEILGRLTSRHGVFFVLGNHDLRIDDEPGLRAQLTDLGFIDLGGRWKVINIQQIPIILAGNELPWFVPAANMQTCPVDNRFGRPLRIALSHSPDQIEWCRNNDCDLMLAGHTHGGQIRLPLIGPVFSPSLYGVKYSAGAFFEDPTLMHVSRGLSGTRPLRFNCTPEITKLTLRV